MIAVGHGRAHVVSGPRRPGGSTNSAEAARQEPIGLSQGIVRLRSWPGLHQLIERNQLSAAKSARLLALQNLSGADATLLLEKLAPL